MAKISVYIFTIASLLLVYSCQLNKVDQKSESQILKEGFVNSYKTAKKVSDYSVMINSLFNIAALSDSSQFGPIMDSLSIIYFNLGMDKRIYQL